MISKHSDGERVHAYEGCGPIPIRIRVSEGTGISCLQLTQDLLVGWQLKSGDVIPARIGSANTLRVKVCLMDAGSEEESRLVLSRKMRFAMPTGGRLWSLYDAQANVLRVGPVIGILTSNTKVMFGPQSGTFRDLMRVGRMKGALVYAFTPMDVHWQHNTISGYHYTGTKGKNGRWTKRLLPLPDVVYNRLPTRADEKNPISSICLKRLISHPEIKVFNTKFLNKWEVTKRLWKSEELLEHMPTTALWKGPRSLLRILGMHGSAFLKPVSNSLGNGAMRIRRTSKGFVWEMNIPGRGTRRRIFTSLPPLISLTSRVIGRHPYLIQECVDMALYKGCTFDIRALVQKNDMGIWCVTGMAARIAQKNRITTHIPNGGRARAVLDTLSVTFDGSGIDAQEIAACLEETAVKAAQAVDVFGEGGFGEVSLDIGVDKKGCVKIFEVNAKPFRFDEESIRQVALRRVIGYSFHISGMGQECGMVR